MAGSCGGILGDKKGRLSVLFGSIVMYSIANILNGFVHSVEMYGLLRFVAGVGLAGELGAGITLVAESLPKQKRGLGTTIVATIGVTGAIAAALVGNLFAWRTCYFIGGGLGLLLLILRVSVRESNVYKKTRSDQKLAHGSIRLLFNNWARFKKFLCCLLSGLPIWGVLGILVTLAPELGSFRGIQNVQAREAVLYAYIGMVVGDLLSGILSQVLKSRKKVLITFEILTLVTSIIYLKAPLSSPEQVYMLCIPLGIAIGYWAVFVTSASEQFGTNLRSTVTTTTPNFVRGMLTPLTLAFAFLKSAGGLDIISACVGRYGRG